MNAGARTLCSVIIPTYSRPAELACSLAALARQSLPAAGFEVIVVDDGSPSSPVSVVRQHESQLDVHLLVTSRGGPSSARNIGAERARGDFLVFTDDDCRPAPNWLEAIAARCSALPDHMIGGRTLNALEDNPCSAISQLIHDRAYVHFNGTGIGEGRFFASNNMAMAADLFRAMGGFDRGFKTSEDRELCDRWIRNGYRLTYAPEAMVYHAHSLDVSGLWWQHVGYGRGAWRFHQMRKKHGGGGLHPEWKFYRDLAIAAFTPKRQARMATMAALMLTAQIANCAGFLYEACQSL